MPKLVTARGVIAVFLFTVVLTGGCRRDETESRTAEGTAGTAGREASPAERVPTRAPEKGEKAPGPVPAEAVSSPAPATTPRPAAPTPTPGAK